MYRAMRWVIGLALGFYYRRIERFHQERVPLFGPVLFTSNHPNSLTDSFVIGATVGRKVNFVATVQLFRIKPLKWLLTRCGVIPINRVKDDPKAMRSVADTFEACYRVLEHGEAIGIFPEGITYDDSQLKEIKSGAARMALELEQRHSGKLGLNIVPVGLTFSAKERYRSEALVHFGEPIRAAQFLVDYEQRRKECIRSLTGEIERRIQGLILHMPELEQRRVVEGIQSLYLKELKVGTRVISQGSQGAGELLLSQSIAAAVAEIFRAQPERAAAFAAKLDVYERWVKRLQVSDEDLTLFSNKRELVGQSLRRLFLVVAGAPIAIYGWVHRLLPFVLVRWAVRRFAETGKRKAQTSSTAIITGIVLFGLFYGLYIFIVHQLLGFPTSLWYALTLAPASLLAHYCATHFKRLLASIRTAVVLLRAPSAAKRLLALRNELVAQIESVRGERQAPSSPAHLTATPGL